MPQELTVEVRRRQIAVLRPSNPIEAAMTPAERQRRLRVARSVLATRNSGGGGSHYSHSPGFFGAREGQWMHGRGADGSYGGFGMGQAAADGDEGAWRGGSGPDGEGGGYMGEGGFVRRDLGVSGGQGDGGVASSGPAAGAQPAGEGPVDQGSRRQWQAGELEAGVERDTEQAKRQRLYGPRSKI